MSDVGIYSENGYISYDYDTFGGHNNLTVSELRPGNIIAVKYFDEEFEQIYMVIDNEYEGLYKTVIDLKTGRISDIESTLCTIRPVRTISIIRKEVENGKDS